MAASPVARPAPLPAAPAGAVWVSAVPSYVLWVLFFAGAYWAVGELGLLFATVHNSVSPIWPATGVAMAGLCMGGARLWPGVAAGSFAVTFAAGLPAGVCVAMAVGNTLEGLAGAWLLWGLSRAVERIRDLPALAAAIIGPPMIAAATGATSLAVADLIPWLAWPDVMMTWWRGDVIGALVVLPLLLELRAGGSIAWMRPLAAEAAFLVAGLIATCVVVFTQLAQSGSGQLLYVVFPFLTWAAWRFGPRGATVATMGIAVAAIWSTAMGLGPFTVGEWSDRIAALQLFLIVASVTALLFGAATADRRLAEAATARSEARQAALLRLLPDIMVRLTPGGTIRDCVANEATVTLPSPKPFIGRSLADWLPGVASDLQQHLARAVETAAPETFALTHSIAGDGAAVQRRGPVDPLVPDARSPDERHLEMRLVPGGADEVVAIVRDVTDRVVGEEERRSLERQLQQSQKLESLGVLAGGIAHDFNNLLTTVLGNASLVRYELPDDAPVQSYLEHIESTATRAADLCRQLLAYAGKGRFTVERLDLSALVRDTTELLQLSISKSVSLKFELAPLLPAVQADATQVRQVLMNLVMNASDAIGAHEGTIHLRTRAVRHARGYLGGITLPADPEDGLYVSVEVEDDGCGISPDLQARVFEPFFTTKFTGRGLGLAAVLGIVRSHGGALHLRSTPGRGSCFTLLLPAVPVAAQRDEPRPMSNDGWRGSGLVLVVDDEANVRTVAQQMLASVGFDVLVAEHGAQGLALFDAHAADVRVVLLDIVMPGLDGHGVLRELRTRGHGTPVVLMSGFTEQAARLSDVTPKPLFLQKPFGRDQLSVAMRRALEG